MGVLLQVTTGKEVLKQANSKVQAFHSPSSSRNPEMKEVVLSAVAKTSPSIVRAASPPSFTHAVVGLRSEVGGAWASQAFDIREGEMVKLFASKRASWNSLMKTACLFIRVRAEAAFQTIKVPLLNVGGKTQLPYAEISGRFDVLTLEDAISYGAVVLPQFYGSFSPALVASLFQVEEKEKAVTVAPKLERKVIKTDEGKQRVITQVSRRRKLDL